MSEKPKFGSKSSSDPNRRHFFKWGDGGPGVGVGKCMYCELRMKFKETGPRGGKVRMYSKDGKSWSEKELQCHVREHAVAAKSPAKKAAKKNGTKRAASGSKKKAVANKSPRKSATKKRAPKKAAPSAEATPATT